MKLITSCPDLLSICLNCTKITQIFLAHLINSHNSINYLSILDCELIYKDDLRWFFEQLDQEGRKFGKVYTGIKDLEHESLITRDEWFIDEKLDIFSLWDMILRKV
jgi:hypothetical protein